MMINKIEILWNFCLRVCECTLERFSTVDYEPRRHDHCLFTNMQSRLLFTCVHNCSCNSSEHVTFADTCHHMIWRRQAATQAVFLHGSWSTRPYLSYTCGWSTILDSAIIATIKFNSPLTLHYIHILWFACNVRHPEHCFHTVHWISCRAPITFPPSCAYNVTTCALYSVRVNYHLTRMTITVLPDMGQVVDYQWKEVHTYCLHFGAESKLCCVYIPSKCSGIQLNSCSLFSRPLLYSAHCVASNSGVPGGQACKWSWIYNNHTQPMLM